MKPEPRKGATTTSKAKSYEAIGAYWDAHELPDAAAKRKPVEFDVDIRRRQ